MIDQYSLPPDGRSARSGISEVQRDAAVRRASLEMMKKQHQHLHHHNKHDTKDVQSEQMTAYVKAWVCLRMGLVCVISVCIHNAVNFLWLIWSHFKVSARKR